MQSPVRPDGPCLQADSAGDEPDHGRLRPERWCDFPENFFPVPRLIAAYSTPQMSQIVSM